MRRSYGEALNATTPAAGATGVEGEGCFLCWGGVLRSMREKLVVVLGQASGERSSKPGRSSAPNIVASAPNAPRAAKPAAIEMSMHLVSDLVLHCCRLA